ncbi:MAG: PLP-dependent aminotransferase family protein [Minicystis sp.]
MDGRIDELIRMAAARPDTITLGGGLPARELFPRRALTEAFVRTMTDPGCAALQYGWPEGSEGLRAWVAQRLARRGAAVEPDDVLITSGAQQALAIAAQILFRPGDRIGCDPESYPAALDLFRARGLLPTPSSTGVAGFYAMPAIGNPRGLGLDDRAREALLARARLLRTPILEDDAYAELRFAGPPPRPLLADDRRFVFHVGTLSKTLCPGLRVGWLVAPRRYRRRAVEAKHASDLQANSLAQALLEDFLARTDYDALVERARRFYSRRAKALARALRAHLPSFRFTEPAGGFTIWVETDREGDDAALLETAIRRGVSFDPGRSFRVDGRSAPIALRLSFAVEPAPRIALGVERLARAWSAYQREARRAA